MNHVAKENKDIHKGRRYMHIDDDESRSSDDRVQARCANLSYDHMRQRNSCL
jgi:hypothetical protein